MMHVSTFTQPSGGTELQQTLWRRYVPFELQTRIHLTVSALPAPKRPLKPHVFWAHQAHDQPSVQNLADPLVQRGIDAFVFVSEWQRDQYIRHLSVPQDRTYVVRNAIEPIARHNKPAGPLRLVYTSTPFRGLDVLLQAFAQLRLTDVELHIYSGMGLYGRSSEDARYQALYEKARSLPGVHYHGVVANAEVRQALKQSHIFAYPCTWEETSCISLIEALGAGCLAVVPDLAALPETAGGYARMYPYQTDKNAHIAACTNALQTAIVQYDQSETTKRLSEQVTHFATVYSWQQRTKEWEALLQGIIKQYGRSI